MEHFSKYIFDDSYVIECLKRNHIPEEYSGRIIIMKSMVSDDFCYYDVQTGERYKYRKANFGWDCETLITKDLVSYVTKKYNTLNSYQEQTVPIYTINEERVSQKVFENRKNNRNINNLENPRGR